MPSVKRLPRNSPRNSVYDRPSGWRLMLRRQRRLLRPAAWFAAASVVVVTIVIAGHSLGNRGGPSSNVSSMRERLGAVAAATGLRVTDIVIEETLISD